MIEKLIEKRWSLRPIFGLIAIFALLNIHPLICFRGGVITVDGPLHWCETLHGGAAYFEQCARQWRVLTTWHWG